jgi:hypothetical protein
MCAWCCNATCVLMCAASWQPTCKPDLSWWIPRVLFAYRTYSAPLHVPVQIIHAPLTCMVDDAAIMSSVGLLFNMNRSHGPLGPHHCCHHLTRRSSLPEASRLPSSFQARRLTQPAWPCNTCSRDSFRASASPKCSARWNCCSEQAAKDPSHVSCCPDTRMRKAA